MNKTITRLLAVLVAGSIATGPVLADPSPGKGPDKHHDKHKDKERYDDRHDQRHDDRRADRHDQRHDDRYDGRQDQRHNDRRAPHRDEHAFPRASITSRDAREIAHQNNIRFEDYKRLPPGIRKNMARGKPLPPGLAARTVPPRYLEHLPHYSGYEWRIYGTDLVLITIGTAIVADILLNALE